MTKKIRVALADDHHLIRAGLKLLLENHDSLAIVGEAADGRTALELVENLQPDILLLDLSMPGMNGLDCLRELKLRNQDVRVIVLTMYEDESYVMEAMLAGARGYVHKSAIDVELYEAIEAVAEGNLHLNEVSAKSLLEQLLDERQNHGIAKEQITLSPREQEVIRLYSRGFSLREIGDQLGLSVKTIDTYKTRIMEKLGFSKKSDLISYALKKGLLDE